MSKIALLNNNADIDGFIVQLPLPKHISENKVIEAIDPSKDADGFHPENLGRMVIGLPCFLPATPYGIIELLKRYQIETKGKIVSDHWPQQYCWATSEHPNVPKRDQMQLLLWFIAAPKTLKN